MPLPRGLAAPFALAAFAVGLSAAGSASAATLEPTVLQPFEQRTADSYPSTPVVVGSTAFFAANDGVHGSELYKTDGTGGGTTLVKDVRVGPEGSGIDTRSLVALAGNVYFTAYSTANSELELWKSDGTAAGTTLVQVIGPPRFSYTTLAVAGDKLFFTAGGGDQDAVHGSELWVTDGSPAGTRLVKDINPGANGSAPFSFARLGTSGSKVVFYAEDATHGYEPWVSDGTEAGTTLLKDVALGGTWSFQNLPNATAVGEKVAFTANAGELWSTDGTEAGTTLVKDLDSYPTELTALGNRLLFTSYDNATGAEPWVSDLTNAGTQAVDLRPGGSGSYPSSFVTDGTTGWFGATGSGTGTELFRTDGTVAGTTAIDVVPGAQGSSNGTVTPIGVAGGRVYFRYATDQTGFELWSVPTAGGTPALVRDIQAGPESTDIPYAGTALGATLLFSADDDLTGVELWRTDGTNAGTTRAIDLNTDATDETKPYGVAIAETRAFYLANTRGKQGLYVTDGTPGGSHLVKAVTKAGDGLGEPALVGETAYFPVAEGPTVTLWRTDGTEAGTKPLRTLPGGTTSWKALASGTGLYFTTDDQSALARGGPPPATTLWYTDGTTDGTVTVATAGLSYIAPLGTLGSTLLLRAQASGAGRELYALDGPSAQLRLVRDISPGSSSSDPDRLVIAGGKAYFVAYTSASGYELWTTDGTTNGTTQVEDIVPGMDGASIGELEPLGDRVVFRATLPGTEQNGLYVSNGTAQGTTPVSTDTAKTGTDPYSFTVFGDKVVYRADGDDGDELYVTDGTAGGTTSLGKLDDYYGDEDMQVIAGRVYFRNEDDVHGRELWSTDGTAAGTRLEADLLAGGGSSYPSLLGELRGGLLLSAYDFTTGRSMQRYGVPIVDEQPPAPQPQPQVQPPTTGGQPAAAPTPAAPKPAPRPVVSRPAPTSVKLTSTKVQRDSKLPYRFVFTGKLGVPKGVSKKAACKGEVVATVKRGDRTVRTAEGDVAKDCTYKVVLRITSLKGLSRNGGRLEVRLRFTGNKVLRPMNAGTATVRYGD